MGRFSTLGLAVWAIVMTPDGAARAGGMRADPVVLVIAPGPANGIELERDDLPAPQLEVIEHPRTVVMPPVPAFEARSGTAGAQLELELDPDARPRLRKFVDDAILETSLEHLKVCNRAIAARDYDAAAAACRDATEVWPDNHLAWYARASAHLAKQQWAEAAVAADAAVSQRPDRAMYQLYLGIALYEVERQRVSDRSASRLESAREALATAVKLAPDLWRAHYYLGRVYRELDDPGRAAQQFTAAIHAHPGYRLAYVALSELYRGKGFIDQALAVALLGTSQLPPAEAAELWFEAGAAYDAGHAEDQAIDAYGRAIAIRPDDAMSRLERGQLYFRRGELLYARRDLETVMRSADPRAVPDRPVAARLLEQIARAREVPVSH